MVSDDAGSRPFLFMITPNTKRHPNSTKMDQLPISEVITGLPRPYHNIRITSRTLWTTTNKLEAGPAAKGRDNEGQMRRSLVCFFGLVATCDVHGTCPMQKLPLFLNLIQMGPRKNKSRISEIPRPGRYRINIKLKNRKQILRSMFFCISTSMPAEYWYVPRVIYVQKFHPTRSCSF